jgi:hypothetical protein
MRSAPRLWANAAWIAGRAASGLPRKRLSMLSVTVLLPVPDAWQANECRPNHTTAASSRAP